MRCHRGLEVDLTTGVRPSVNNVFHLERFTTLKMTLWSLQVFSTVKWNHNLEKKDWWVFLQKKEQSDCHDLYDMISFIVVYACMWLYCRVSDCIPICTCTTQHIEDAW